MRRIAVVGCGGAGKSTFARALGERLDLPVINLDRHYWKPGWVETIREEWIERQRELFAGDAWIADGNYVGTYDVRFDVADTVVVLGLPRWRCLSSALWRAVRNYGDDIQAEGCPERIDPGFIKWIWRFERDQRPRLDHALERHPGLDVIELTSRRAIARFIDGI